VEALPHCIELSGQLHAPGALSPGKEPRYPLGKGWAGPRAGLDAMTKISGPFESRSAGRQARNLATTLTELSSPAPSIVTVGEPNKYPLAGFC
jgi:hypothetical protein